MVCLIMVIAPIAQLVSSKRLIIVRFLVRVQVGAPILGVLAELVEGAFLLRKYTSKGYHWFESNTLRQERSVANGYSDPEDEK